MLGKIWSSTDKLRLLMSMYSQENSIYSTEETVTQTNIMSETHADNMEQQKQRDYRQIRFKIVSALIWKRNILKA